MVPLPGLTHWALSDAVNPMINNKMDNGLISIDVKSSLVDPSYKDMKILINNSNEKKVYCDDEYYALLELEGAKVRFKNIIIPPVAIDVIYKS